MAWYSHLFKNFPQNFPQNSIEFSAMMKMLCICAIQYVSQVVKRVMNLPAMQETQVQSLGQEDPDPPVYLPGEFHGQMSLAGYNSVHGVAKSWT